MPKVQVVNMQGSPVGEMELNETIFGIEPNTHVMHSAVVAQLANARVGTHSTLGRSEVRGGGRKPWKQKGTGRARAGTIRSPLWRGGGIVFGPKPRDYSKKLPKKVKRLALCSALSSKVIDNSLIVVDQISFEQPKTKEMVKLLEALKIDKKALLVVENNDDNNVLVSARNIQGVLTSRADALNVIDLLKYDFVVFTKAAVMRTEEVLSNA
ncbi:MULTISPECIES: 50S ribosomal protein L4 [Dehalobacter]|jgi:Ribosomal protein L4|uniref:Large ribosomal subunit protein uL4 n=2 Tax=Dehalobacter restrictus TaxID=55583 RepID=A0A857DH75_9FIRM|nr:MULTISPECIES: 50S ribosomal protein L4 [Dehalobacter]AFV02912.1 LSU ribosomal protein L4p (L1e) [Dehalobacter sp. DCA]AFV05899.1 LSU ribosomal protein L4p (L1e) [Dehalobacter sp. CF]AHF09105.1 50S ribosomal protein L4 [Dehalobacter restrictus DSM 9455]EQB22568.1 LSU ribosomal protein L4p (L1e) [Dehalobacter sp. UNSWDHB]MCG1024440.1 50S ribosomal protein L4 [Dehalobacter sp.]